MADFRFQQIVLGKAHGKRQAALNLLWLRCSLMLVGIDWRASVQDWAQLRYAVIYHWTNRG